MYAEKWKLTNEELEILKEEGSYIAFAQEAKKRAFIEAGGVILNPDALPDLYEALKTLPAPKSILAEAAYTGADVPKKWISDRGNYIDGYNQALKDVKQRSDKAVAKADGGK